MSDASSLQERLLSVPNLQSAAEKREYLEAIFRGEAPFPLMNGGMGIDFSGTDLVVAMMRENAIGVLAASAPGYELLRPGLKIKGKELHEYTHAEREELLRQWNQNDLNRMIGDVRKQCENSVLGANCMKILTHYENTLEDMIASKEIDIGYFGAGLPRDLPERMAQEDAQHMYYVPIVSSVAAAELIVRAAIKKNGRLPDTFYLELPQYAGGHLGWMKDDSERPERFNPETLRDEMKAMCKKYEINKHIPIILAGGIAFRDQIQAVLDLDYEVAMATPLLISQESGMPNKTLEQKYLNPDVAVVADTMSPTKFWSRRLDTPHTKRTPESIGENVHRCVQCVISKCEYYKKQKDLENDGSYCIANDLSRARFGLENGIYFVGTNIILLRKSGIYTLNGAPNIPTIHEILQKLLRTSTPVETSDAPA